MAPVIYASLMQLQATSYTGTRPTARGRTVVISASELAGLRTSAIPESEKIKAEFRKEPEIVRRDQISKKRSSTWSNTIEGARQQRLEAAERRKKEKEDFMMKIHEEELALEMKNHDEIIQRAIDYYKNETEPARIVVQAQEAMDVKRGQLKQIEEKKEMKAQEEQKRLAYAAELRRISELEQKKREEDEIKRKNSENERKEINRQQIELNRTKKLQQKAENMEDYERLKLAAQEEKAKEEARKLERMRQQRQSDIDNAKFVELGEEKKAAEIEKEKLAQLEREFYDAKKDKMAETINAIKQRKRDEVARRREILTLKSAEALEAEKAKHAIWDGLKEDTFYADRDREQIARKEKWDRVLKNCVETNDAILAAKKARQRAEEDINRERLIEEKRKREEEERLELEKRREIVRKQQLYKQAQKSQIDELLAREKAEREYKLQQEKTEIANFVDNPKKEALEKLKTMDTDPTTRGALLVAARRVNALN